MDVFLFGDQTADQVPLLKKIFARRDNSLLSTFLERSSLAVREEIQRLPKPQRDAIPDFLTISQLVQLYNEKGSKVPAIESALVTIAQLGHYIGYVPPASVRSLPNSVQILLRECFCVAGPKEPPISWSLHGSSRSNG